MPLLPKFLVQTVLNKETPQSKHSIMMPNRHHRPTATTAAQSVPKVTFSIFVIVRIKVIVKVIVHDFYGMEGVVTGTVENLLAA